MKIHQHFDLSSSPFEGDRRLPLRRLPAGARVVEARVRVIPVDVTGGEDPFAERLEFTGNNGDFGATLRQADDGVEVDLHARRTLAEVSGTGLAGTRLQVEMGGVFVAIAADGTVSSAGSQPFALAASPAELPGLTASRFRLWQEDSSAASPAVRAVVVRGVPSNVSLALGDLAPFWRQLGELTEVQTSPDFSVLLQGFLTEAPVENGTYLVPLVVHSDSLARLRLELDVEFLVERSALPEGLSEVALSYAFGEEPIAAADSLQLSLPPGARVRQVAGRVTGSFDETRIAWQTAGRPAGPPEAAASVTAATSQAQPLELAARLDAEAVDLLLSAVSREARLQLDLRQDVDGKPGERSLLATPAELTLDRDTAGTPTWLSVPLAQTVQLAAGTSWLVLQSLEGEVEWSTRRTGEERLALQHTDDGGLSWRRTAGEGERLAAFLRLRYRPAAFSMPLTLAVGTGEAERRVSLERFTPVGRVDFSLDFPPALDAINAALAAGSAACPEGEHLANADFASWIQVGDALGEPRQIELASLRPFTTDAVVSPAVAVSADGRTAFVAGGLLGFSDLPLIPLVVVDLVCAEVIETIPLGLGFPPFRLVPDPGGRWLYAALGNELVVVDLEAGATLGSAVDLAGGTEIQDLGISPDATTLFAATHDIEGFDHSLEAVETATVRQVARRGGGSLDSADVRSVALTGLPLDLVVAADGTVLYLLVDEPDFGGSLFSFDAGSLSRRQPSLKVANGANALSISGDGATLLVSAPGRLGVVDAAQLRLRRGIESEGSLAAVIEPSGGRAFVLDESSLTARGLDGSGRSSPQGELPSGLDRVVVTPAGDQLLLTRPGGGSGVAALLVQVPVGLALPEEWAVSGRIARRCMGDPRRAGVHVQAQEVAAALSQVVSVVSSCPYEFSFLAAASGDDAVAEVHWLSAECGPSLQRDTVPIVGSEELQPHSVRLTSPEGATQAEVRFSIPAGTAFVGQASLRATADTLVNGDLGAIGAAGLPEGWERIPGSEAGLLVSATAGGVRLRNSAAAIAGLRQEVAAAAGESFDLTVESQAVTEVDAGIAAALVELRWQRADATAIGEPLILELEAAGGTASGTVPAGAEQATVELLLPPGAEVILQRLTLESRSSEIVPLAFIPQAPGALKVTDWRVSYERLPAVPPPVAVDELCPPTPPGAQPGEADADCCTCCCCGKEQPVNDPAQGLTTAGRPIQVVTCADCDAPAVRVGGRPANVAHPLTVRRLPAARPAPLRSHGSAALRRPERTPAEMTVAESVVERPPLTAVRGIGAGRARLLAAIGLDSLVKLAFASPERVAELLPFVSPRIARGFIAEARTLLRASVADSSVSSTS